MEAAGLSKVHLIVCLIVYTLFQADDGLSADDAGGDGMDLKYDSFGSSSHRDIPPSANEDADERQSKCI